MNVQITRIARLKDFEYTHLFITSTIPFLIESFRNIPNFHTSSRCE